MNRRLLSALCGTLSACSSGHGPFLPLGLDAAVNAFEALAGVGRLDEARQIARLVLGGDDHEVRARLAKAARRAGNPELAAEMLAAGR